MKQLKYHYVYRITNKQLNKYYYGVRTSINKQPSEDIGIHYFSSSRDKNFINDQRNNSQDYSYKVIYTFKTRDEANLFEIKIHSKFNVGINEKFYNLSSSTSSGWSTFGRKATLEQRKKLSKSKIECFDKNKHNTSISVKIFDSLNNEKFHCVGNFRKTIKKHNLPLKLQDSYKNNGEPIFKNLSGPHLNRLINRGADKYIGWYAIKMD